VGELQGVGQSRWRGYHSSSLVVTSENRLKSEAARSITADTSLRDDEATPQASLSSLKRDIRRFCEAIFSSFGRARHRQPALTYK
jgi:hypothetical protein